MDSVASSEGAEELEAVNQRIMAFNQSAQQNFSASRWILCAYHRESQEAVNKVAADNGFAYVLDASASKAVVVYLDGGEDIMPLVKAELGIR